MEIVRDQTFQKGEIVPIDGHYYLNCKGEGCVFLYGGGDFGWRNCIFRAVGLQFVGSAQKTIRFLEHFGLKPQQIEQPATPPEKVN